jgi:outer membrane protein assembly factor BamB
LAGKTFWAGSVLGLYAFDITTGDLVWEYKNKKKHGGFVSQPVFIGGRLYAGNCAGNEFMYCFEGGKGKE